MASIRDLRYEEIRRDRTCTLRIAVSEHELRSTHEETNSTLHVRRFDPHEGWTAESKTLNDASDQGLDVCQADICNDLSALQHEMSGLRLAVRLEHQWRTFVNSEQTSFSLERSWGELLLAAPQGRISTDGVVDFRDIVPVAKKMLAKTRNRREPRDDGLRTVEPTLDLWLDPAVAAILLHEMVGHGSEQLQSEIRIGPADLQVTSILPGDRDVDDEGVEKGTIPVVVDGVLTRRVGSRESVDGAPSGLCQASSHAYRPRPRCTHLVAHATATDVGVGFTGARCESTLAAVFSRGMALVAVDRAGRYVGGRLIGAYAPFVFTLPLAAASRHFRAFGSPNHEQRLGTCLKFGDPLPSLTIAPEILLSEISCRPV